MTRVLRRARPALPILLALLASPGCDAIPVDPDDTLLHIEQRGELRVGVTDNPPLIHVAHDGQVRGVEADLVTGLARELGVGVHWAPMAETEIVDALEHGVVDLGIGGFIEPTVHKPHVAVSRPWAHLHGESHVVFVPAGENRWLVRVEHYLHDHEDELQRAAWTADTDELHP